MAGMKRPPQKLLNALQEAETLKDANKISKAAQSARSAYAMAVEYLPASHPERRRAARILGLLLLNLNQKGEAEKLLRESGDLTSDGEIDAQVSARNNAVGLQMQQGATRETLQAALDNLAFARTHLAPDAVGTTMAMAHLGHILEQLGDLKAAEKVFAEVLELRRSAPPNSELLVAALLDLARIYLRNERHTKCEPLYKEALQMQEEQGNQDLGLAVTLNQYGAVCNRMGRHAEALEHLQRGLDLRRSILGADHPQVATGLHGLVALYTKLEQYEKADEALQQCWLISDRGRPRSPQNPAISGRARNELDRPGARARRRGPDPDAQGQKIGRGLPSRRPKSRPITTFRRIVGAALPENGRLLKAVTTNSLTVRLARTAVGHRDPSAPPRWKEPDLAGHDHNADRCDSCFWQESNSRRLC